MTHNNKTRAYIFICSLLLTGSCFAEENQTQTSEKSPSEDQTTTESAPAGNNTTTDNNDVEIVDVVELDLAADDAALDAFLDTEAKDLEKFAKKFKEDAAFREKLAELFLSCQPCRFTANDGTVVENMHFRDLPEDIKKGFKQRFIADYAAWLTGAAQKIQASKPSWHGLTPLDVAFLLPLCYTTGRQVRGAGVPGIDELLTLSAPLKIAGDVALGYAANMFATLCHECGHAVVYRMMYGRWPESVTIGSSNSKRPAIISTPGGALALRGLNLNGVTSYPGNGISLHEARSIPVCAAGGICGIAGYHGFRKLVYGILGKELSMMGEMDARYKWLEGQFISGNNSIRGLFGLAQNTNAEMATNFFANHPQLTLAILPLVVDMAAWLELKNVLLEHDSQGTDANCIATATKFQLDKLWDTIAAKIKKMREKKQRKNTTPTAKSA